MDSFDSSTWQALGLVLTVVGLLVSVLVWRSRGAAAGLRGVAWSLLPVAAGLTGTLRLLWQIGDSVVSWATRLVFSPVVWLGLATAGVSLMLFALSALMRSRGVGTKTGRDTRRVDGEQAPSLPRERSAKPAAPGRSAKPSKPAVGDEDMDDIEAILRKHGIQ